MGVLFDFGRISHHASRHEHRTHAAKCHRQKVTCPGLSSATHRIVAPVCSQTALGFPHLRHSDQNRPGVKPEISVRKRYFVSRKLHANSSFIGVDNAHVIDMQGIQAVIEITVSADIAFC